MKFAKYLMSFAAATWLLAGCEVEPTDLYSKDPVAPVLDTHAAILITEATTQEIVTFSWSAARNLGSNVTYIVEAALAGNDALPAELAETAQLSVSLTKQELSDFLMENFEISKNEFILHLTVAAVDDETQDSYTSSTLSVNIIDNTISIYPEKLYLPGSYQSWDPPSAPTLEGDGNGHYEGGVNLSGEDDVEFKFAVQPAWGGDFGGSITIVSGYGEGTCDSGDNIKVPAGYYYITVDKTQDTFTMQLITTIGIVGDAVGSWDVDVPMTYNAEANVWTLTTALQAAQFKARFNGGWDLNRGAGGANEPYEMTNGEPVDVYHNGKNLSVAEAGNYLITLDLSTYPNTLTVEKQ